jgi:hypothetical protein
VVVTIVKAKMIKYIAVKERMPITTQSEMAMSKMVLSGSFSSITPYMTVSRIGSYIENSSHPKKVIF